MIQSNFCRNLPPTDTEMPLFAIRKKMSFTAIIAFALCMFVATVAFAQMSEDQAADINNLVYFKGIGDTTGNTLFWETSGEINTSYFSIERSCDHVTWEEVAKLKGEGNSVEQIPYSWKDDSPYPGFAYYRLKEVLESGKSVYSESIVVESKNHMAIEIYPNPAEGLMKLTVFGKENQHSKVMIKSMAGGVIFKADIPNNYPVELDIEEFPLGVYSLEAEGPDGSKIQKLIKR